MQKAENSIYFSWLDKNSKTQFKRFLKAFPDFDEKNHFVVAISDSSGNCLEFVGAAKDESSAKSVLKVGWKRKEKNYSSFRDVSVELLKNRRLVSYVI